MSENLKLGSIITTPQHRDAVHIAVVPVKAAVALHAGQAVRLENGEAVSCYSSERIGVVDPFLLVTVKAGQEFWLFLNPGSITSLRHEWTHPAFKEPEPQKLYADVNVSDEEYQAQLATLRDLRAEAEAWLRNFADTRTCETYESLINVAKAGWSINIGAYEFSEDWDSEAQRETFWRNIELVTGERFDSRHRDEVYFSCSC